jgi:hypothetical protein
MAIFSLATVAKPLAARRVICVPSWRKGTFRESQRRVEALEEIDLYVLGFTEKIGAD